VLRGGVCFGEHGWRCARPEKADEILSEVRLRGFATCDLGFIGGTAGLVAIVVALSDGAWVHGSI
jgi:hypothetical protein